MNNIQGVIFDLDGTLIDSMKVWEDVDRIFLEKRNISVPKSLKNDIEKMNFNQCAAYFKQQFNLKESTDEILSEWNQMVINEYKNNILLKPGALKLLKLLKSKNIKIGLATSTMSSLINISLKKHDVYEFFDAITTIDEVCNSKEFPDIYLLTANKLNVNPKNCLVFEDMPGAVKGASLAQMKVIGIYDDYYKEDELYMKKNCYKFIQNFEELREFI